MAPSGWRRVRGPLQTGHPLTPSLGHVHPELMYSLTALKASLTLAEYSKSVKPLLKYQHTENRGL